MRRQSLVRSLPEVALVLAGVAIAAAVTGALHAH
jgi:hypothetical protein